MKKYIPSINGLRAISIFCVLFSHVESRNFGKHDAPGGQIGVNIFFIISGYLITLLLLQEESVNKSISLRNFFIRRTLRIFPVYYFLLLVYFVLQKFDVLYFTLNSWLLSLTYTKYFVTSNITEWEIGHLWSLSVEEHFYLIWPLIFSFSKSLRLPFAIIVIMSTTLVRLFTNVSELSILTRADALMIGCVFAMFNGEVTSFLKVLWKQNKLLISIPFIVLFSCITFKRIFGIVGIDLHTHFILAFAGSYGLLTNISVALILLISVNFKDNFWYKFLNNKIVNYIGLLSYSIYIWQQLFFSPKIVGISKFPMNLLYIFIIANISYFLIEKPFLKLKSRFIKQDRRSSANKEVQPQS